MQNTCKACCLCCITVLKLLSMLWGLHIDTGQIFPSLPHQDSRVKTRESPMCELCLVPISAPTAECKVVTPEISNVMLVWQALAFGAVRLPLGWLQQRQPLQLRPEASPPGTGATECLTGPVHRQNAMMKDEDLS